MRFVQLKAGSERRLAMVEEPKLRLLRDFNSLYTLAQAAIITGDKLTAQIGDQPKSHHHAARENRKCRGKAGRTAMSRILHGIGQGCHVKESCAQDAASAVTVSEKT